MQTILTVLITALLICITVQTQRSLGETYHNGRNIEIAQDESGTEITVEEILRGHYKAIGGDAAWKAIETLKFTGSMYTKEATFKTAGIYKRPNLCRVDYQSGPLYFMEAYNGKIAWQMNPATKTGPEVLQGKRAKEMIDTCDFDGLLIDHKQKGHKIRFLGTEEIEGRQAYVLEVKSQAGNTDMYYLDKKTYLPFMVKGKTTIQDQTVNTTINIGEYIKIGDITIPFSYAFIVDGNPSSEKLKIKTIELNSEYDDDIFNLPKRPQDLR